MAHASVIQSLEDDIANDRAEDAGQPGDEADVADSADGSVTAAASE